MDVLDFAIFRQLSPGGEARFWATRCVIDPRISAREIADRVGISENGVRARLRSLEKRGFLRGGEVCPNPSLFGASMVVAEIPVRDTNDVDRLFAELALVEGVTFARDILDEDNRKLRVHYVSDTPAATTRRTALLRRLSPSGTLRGPDPYWIPTASRELSPLDWRLLRTLRKLPDAPIARVAAEVRISLKTAARRYHLLIDGQACWWTHSRESEEVPLALLSVSVPEPSARSRVATRISEELENWMPVAPGGLGSPPQENSTLVAGLTLIATPTSVERIVRRILAFPGVVSVRRTFALGYAAYPEWFDQRIAEEVARPS